MCRKSTSPVATNLYTFRNERSDELGGMAVNDLWIRRGIANLLDPNGMAGSEIVDAPCVSGVVRKEVKN